MTGLRRDYIVNEIELLGQFIARLVNKRDEVGLHEAMHLALHLQEKLFAMPVAEFLRLEASGQIAALTAGESKANGQAKCLAYATLLRDTATLYRLQGRDELAAGARQLALHVTLSVALDSDSPGAPTDALVEELCAHFSHDDLHPPVRELLERYEVRRHA